MSLLERPLDAPHDIALRRWVGGGAMLWAAGEIWYFLASCGSVEGDRQGPWGRRKGRLLTGTCAVHVLRD